jgi:predicted RNA binding protein YcfA (HicA-like mRNA interferase family)
MPRLPVLKATELIRQKGSHVRMKHPEGRVVTVPVHPGQDVGRGLLRKVLRDAELTRDEFMALLK